MKTITISILNKSPFTANEGVTTSEILNKFECPNDSILAVKINNELCSLSQQIDINCTLEPILIGTHEGSAIYRRTLCFVLAAAAQELFPNRRLVVGHSRIRILLHL